MLTPVNGLLTLKSLILNHVTDVNDVNPLQFLHLIPIVISNLQSSILPSLNCPSQNACGQFNKIVKNLSSVRYAKFEYGYHKNIPARWWDSYAIFNL